MPSGITLSNQGQIRRCGKIIRQGHELEGTTFWKNKREYINSLHNMAVIKKIWAIWRIGTHVQLPGSDHEKTVHGRIHSICGSPWIIRPCCWNWEDSKRLGNYWKEALRLGRRYLTGSISIMKGSMQPGRSSNNNPGTCPPPFLFQGEAVTGMENKGLDDHPDFNNLMIYYGAAKISNHDRMPEITWMKWWGKGRRYETNTRYWQSAISTRGDFYFDKGDYSSAAEDYRSSLDIFKSPRWTEQAIPGYADQKANCNWKLGRGKRQPMNSAKPSGNTCTSFIIFFPSMSETEKAGFYATCKPGIESYMSFVAENGENKPSLIKDLFNLRMETKGILINATRQVRNNIMYKADAETVELYKEWMGLKNTILSYYSSPLEDQKDDKVNLSDLEKQANEAEKQLSKRSARFGDVLRKTIGLWWPEGRTATRWCRHGNSPHQQSVRQE